MINVRNAKKVINVLKSPEALATLKVVVAVITLVQAVDIYAKTKKRHDREE